jgi:DNA-binding winged helix-turn-helix (wHTH) protein
METEDRVFRFGPYVLDARRRQLLRGGEPLKLYPKEFDTLLALVERRGRVVEKDELLNAVWLGAAVEEGNLTTHVSHLRKLLGGAGTDRDYIATIPGRGYEFVGQVSEPARELERSKPLTVEAPRFTVRRGFKLTLALMAATVLVGLAFMASRGARDTRPSPEQLTFGRGTIWSARFAPDGQVLYGAAWDGRPIAPFSTRLGGAESTGLGFPGDVLAISASGEMLVLLDRVLVPGWGGSAGTLAKVSLAGGAPKEWLRGVTDADLSPDGRETAIARQGRLEFPVGNPIYQVEGFIKQPRISRTADAVAFLQRSGGDESVEIVTRLRERQTLARGLTGLTGLAWSSTGREVFFSVTRPGKTELRAVTTSGAQRQVAEAAGEWKLHDVAPDGRVLMTLDHTRGYTIGAAMGEPERDLSWLDRSIAIDLSADGRLLLLGEIGAGGGETGKAYLRGMDGSPAMRLGEGQPAALSPDGKWAIVNNQGRPERLVLVPTGPGGLQSLENGAIVDYYGVRFLPDSRHIVFAAIAPGRGRKSYFQDTRTRSAPLEWHAPIWGTAFFPDGRRYVARKGGQYYVFDMDGAELQRVPNIANRELVIQTAADGQSVFVLAHWERPTMTITINRVDLSTGQRTRWKDVVIRDPVGVMHTHPGFMPFLMTHDGSTYVYNYLRVLSTLYVVENLK